MATVPTHAFVGLAVTDLVAGRHATWPLRIAGAVCAALPDLDVLLMRYADVAYADPWGHRGITHGLAFAVGLGFLVTLLFFRRSLPSFLRIGLALTLATASQGALDALTDGGLGVAFLAPFGHERYFFPWTPIPVAPLSVRGIFTAYGAGVLAAELVRVVLPCAVLMVLARRWSVAKPLHAERSSRSRIRPSKGDERCGSSDSG